MSHDPTHPWDNADDPPDIPNDRLWYAGADHTPLTWAAERAYAHYGFKAPLDDAAWDCFALLMFHQWGLDDSDVCHFRSAEEAVDCYWDEVADHDRMRCEYQAESYQSRNEPWEF